MLRQFWQCTIIILVPYRYSRIILLYSWRIYPIFIAMLYSRFTHPRHISIFIYSYTLRPWHHISTSRISTARDMTVNCLILYLLNCLTSDFWTKTYHTEHWTNSLYSPRCSLFAECNCENKTFGVFSANEMASTISRSYVIIGTRKR